MSSFILVTPATYYSGLYVVGTWLAIKWTYYYTYSKKFRSTRLSISITLNVFEAFILLTQLLTITVTPQDKFVYFHLRVKRPLLRIRSRAPSLLYTKAQIWLVAVSVLSSGRHIKGFCLKLELFWNASVLLRKLNLPSCVELGCKATDKEILWLFTEHQLNTRYWAKHFPHVFKLSPLNSLVR